MGRRPSRPAPQAASPASTGPAEGDAQPRPDAARTLARTFWRHHLPAWLLSGLTVGLMTWAAQHLAGPGLRAVSAALLIAWPAALAWQAWTSVLVWRAATAHARGAGRALTALGARFAALATLAVALASTAWNYGPHFNEHLQLARGIDPLGQATITVSADGHRLRVQGPLGLGDAQRVHQAAADAPGLRLLVLQSARTRPGEAEAVAGVVRAHGWAVRVDGPCENACTLVLMAGTPRQLTPDARLGLQRPALASFNPVLLGLAALDARRVYAEAGWPDAVVARQLRTPPWRMWFPGDAELKPLGLFSLPSPTLDPDLPLPAGALPDDYLDALQAHPVWAVLNRHHPDLVALAARRLYEAGQAGAGAAALVHESQQVLADWTAPLLARASPELRARFAELLAAQLQAVRAQGAQACAAVLAGEVGVRQTLPPALREQEAAWVASAATEPPRERAQKPPGALEFEVVRRSLGEGTPSRLLGLWRAAGSPAAPRDCDTALALLAEVSQLPPGERKLATRLMFEKPS